MHPGGWCCRPPRVRLCDWGMVGVYLGGGGGRQWHGAVGVEWGSGKQAWQAEMCVAPSPTDLPARLCLLAVMLRLVLWALATLLLPTQQVYGGPGGSSYLWVRLFGFGGWVRLRSWRGRAVKPPNCACACLPAGSPLGGRPASQHAAVPLCCCAALLPSRCPWALASWAAFSLSLVYLVFALRWMTGAGASRAVLGPALPLLPWSQLLGSRPAPLVCVCCRHRPGAVLRAEPCPEEAAAEHISLGQALGWLLSQQCR